MYLAMIFNHLCNNFLNILKLIYADYINNKLNETN